MRSFRHGRERLWLGGSACEWASIGAEWRVGGRRLCEEGLQSRFLGKESCSTVSGNTAYLDVSDGRGIGACSSEEEGSETKTMPESARHADVKPPRVNEFCPSTLFVLFLFLSRNPRVLRSGAMNQRPSLSGNTYGSLS